MRLGPDTDQRLPHRVVVMDNEMGVRIVLLVVLVGSGFLLIWLARATASGHLKRNTVAEIRVPSTMVSDEAWLAAHVRAKRPTTLAGISSVASGLVALLPVPATALAVAALAGCATMLGFVLYGARVGSQAAIEVSNRSGN